MNEENKKKLSEVVRKKLTAQIIETVRSLDRSLEKAGGMTDPDYWGDMNLFQSWELAIDIAMEIPDELKRLEHLRGMSAFQFICFAVAPNGVRFTKVPTEKNVDD